MPTKEHEYLIELVRNRPSLVTSLLAGVGISIPSFDEAQLGDCDDAAYRRPPRHGPAF
ncbi:hypothetical protein [Nonomuraea sp. NPDC050643]|uniref:hypothetical protein n=1 Tax=Nonomuraea sp. NPDC050643 TaxID=3155660 RepID=UPI0033C8CC80